MKPFYSVEVWEDMLPIGYLYRTKHNRVEIRETLDRNCYRTKSLMLDSARQYQKNHPTHILRLLEWKLELWNEEVLNGL